MDDMYSRVCSSFPPLRPPLKAGFSVKLSDGDSASLSLNDGSCPKVEGMPWRRSGNGVVGCGACDSSVLVEAGGVSFSAKRPLGGSPCLRSGRGSDEDGGVTWRSTGEGSEACLSFASDVGAEVVGEDGGG